MDDALDSKADADERDAKREMAADKAASEILKQADANGQPKATAAPTDNPFKMVGGAPRPAAPQEPPIMVPVAEAAAFIVRCSVPDVIAEGNAPIVGRSLPEIMDVVFGKMAAKFGDKVIEKLEDVDSQPGVMLSLQYNLPTVAEPPKPDVKEVSVVQRTVVPMAKPSVAISGMMRKIIPVEQLMNVLVQSLVARAAVSGIQLCAITMVDKDGKVGGAVVSNPTLPMTNALAVLLYETMKNHAEEFKRNCEKQGIQFNSLIIPTGVQMSEVLKKHGGIGGPQAGRGK